MSSCTGRRGSEKKNRYMCVSLSKTDSESQLNIARFLGIIRTKMRITDTSDGLFGPPYPATSNDWLLLPQSDQMFAAFTTSVDDCMLANN